MVSHQTAQKAELNQKREKTHATKQTDYSYPNHCHFNAIGVRTEHSQQSEGILTEKLAGYS